MRLTMLGTGNANVLDYYNTCFVLSDKNPEGDAHFLVDGGGGNRILKVLKDAGIGLRDIHDLFVTHEHIDHILGVIWLIRMIGQKMNKGQYKGKLRIYCHKELEDKLRTIAEMTIQKKVCRNFGEKILFEVVAPGETREIIGCPVTFFDIASTKAKQFGFTMRLPDGRKLTCAGDEPYREEERQYVEGSDWLLHEAFCLHREAELFNPYEKHHSTVKEACELAENFGIPNLLLYHTEESHGLERERLYLEEGAKYYHGRLYVPDDLEMLEL